MDIDNLRSTSGHPSTTSRRARGRGSHRLHFAPALTVLEPRALLSTLTVTNDNDSGKGSLRYELGLAQAGDVINFSAKAYGTITLTSGPLEVAAGVDIDGPGAPARSPSAETPSPPSSRSRREWPRRSRG